MKPFNILRLDGVGKVDRFAPYLSFAFILVLLPSSVTFTFQDSANLLSMNICKNCYFPFTLNTYSVTMMVRDRSALKALFQGSKATTVRLWVRCRQGILVSKLTRMSPEFLLIKKMCGEGGGAFCLGANAGLCSHMEYWTLLCGGSSGSSACTRPIISVGAVFSQEVMSSFGNRTNFGGESLISSTWEGREEVNVEIRYTCTQGRTYTKYKPRGG